MTGPTARPSSGACAHCGEEIVRDEHGVWHHASDDAVVCAIGLDPKRPGEIVAQCAQPVQDRKVR